jgi:hypothetical protein
VCLACAADAAWNLESAVDIEAWARKIIGPAPP